MAERITGIDVSEEPDAGQGMARAPTGITAFVGRTLRGPINRPVLLRGFADFERVFGGLWQPSTLSYAVEQYFENGGGAALVVRVANGARACTLDLPAGPDRLTLRAIAPGTSNASTPIVTARDALPLQNALMKKYFENPRSIQR